jgi:quercetin dioxygenase-like cupin family protein
MKVVKSCDVKASESKSDLFIGKVLRQNIMDEKIAKELRIGVVNFDPGARTKWHTHTNEQVLYVVDGKGIVATEEEEVVVTQGTFIFIPSGEKHWHGATPETSFSHMSIQSPGETNVTK